VYIHNLDKGSKFTFQQDNNRPKDIYWFLKMDGMYAQIFSSESDMKSFNKPEFVAGATIVDKVED